MELRQLRYFIKIAETLNFSEAAKELATTQSALSQQIKQLEAEFNTQLFYRDSHSVKLTEDGEVLLPVARDTVSRADMCSTRMADLRNLTTGTLNIGATYSFSPILTETIFEFTQQHKGVKLNICYIPMAELMEMLRDRKIDFVLAFKPSLPMPGIESHPLFQSFLAVIVNKYHPLASLKSIPLQKLSDYSLALPSKGLQARNAFDAVVDRIPTDLKIRIELNDPDILLDIVRQSNLVTILAEASIYKEIGVTAIPLDIADNEMTGCVHILEDTYHKKSMQAFIRILSESLAVKERAISWL